MSQLPKALRRHSVFSKAGDGYLGCRGKKGGRRQACLRRVTSIPARGQFIVDEIIEEIDTKV
jgi:hypothetical protein